MKAQDEPKTDPKRPTKAPFSFSRGSHVELAKALLYKLETNEAGKIKFPIYDEGSFYQYDTGTGIWDQLDENRAGKIVQDYDGYHVGDKILKLKESDVKGALACARREVFEPRFFADAPPGLVFRDTFIRVMPNGAIEKVAHASANRARFAYDFDYVEDEPTKFLETLEGMFAPDKDAKEKIRFIGEFAGACLLGVATKLQRWVLLRGLGDDGKSTLIDMIRTAMPPGSTCSIRPEDLEDEYSRAGLAGKLLNTVTEIKQKAVLDAETLKAVTVGDEMQGRHIHQAPIQFKPRAGHLYAANGYPKFSDSSHGFWRRPIVVTFNRRFTGDPEREMGRADTVMAAERAHVVCWLIRHGAKAFARESYLEPRSHFIALKEWRGETDAVFEFLDEKLVASKNKTASTENGWSRPNDLYQSFLTWAIKTGRKAMSSNAFGRRLTDLGHTEIKTNGVRFRPLRPLRDGELKKDDGSIDDN